MRSLVTVLVAAFALASTPLSAADRMPVLVNLARLSIARVSVSSPDERPESEQFYGVQRLFDADAETLYGINYKYWTANGPLNWVMLRFSMPVTFCGLVMTMRAETPDEGVSGPMRVQVRGAGGRSLGLSPVVSLGGGPLITYVPTHRVENVREVTIYFGGSRFHIDEIEVMGPPPAGLDLTPRTPPVDLELVLPTAEGTKTGKGSKEAFLKTIAEARLDKLRVIRGSIDAASNDHDKAKAWLRLNLGIEELIDLLGDAKGMTPVLKEARPLGISIATCGNEPPWDVGVEGYNRYLRLWADGPDADQAWWYGRVHGDRCGEFEGTEDEYRDFIARYKTFLAKFPRSRFAVQAQEAMTAAMDDLAKVTKQ